MQRCGEIIFRDETETTLIYNSKSFHTIPGVRPRALLQDFHDHHIAKKTPTPGFCCTCGAPPPAEKLPLDEFKTLIFALSNAPGCANLKGREAAQLVTEDNVHHLAFMVIERAAATERSEDRATLATFLDAIDPLQPIFFATLKTSRLVMKAIDHLSSYATSSPTADDAKYRKTLANLVDFAGKLLAKLDHVEPPRDAAFTDQEQMQREMSLLAQFSPEQQADMYRKERQVNEGDAELEDRLARRTEELAKQYQQMTNTEKEEDGEEEDGEVPEWFNEPLPETPSLPPPQQPQTFSR
ncbi:unnamed protein product [Vitrella brassicaformis CCMP3155]|uniref:Uncharacterized protein n=1 Tax=Vitrella brassicaformis (strain CCMP3155) TaxID=1169540 RepID=A0A0G4H516_VITBC|nr:unnamed protein product [Vitrella brassicaformis CCMP3155]|eukprot:CEM38875.1 unnamed protein product [Vitrella brassicaformis CCMP3155]